MKATYNIKSAGEFIRSNDMPTKKLMTAIVNKIADGTLKGVQMIGNASFPNLETQEARIPVKSTGPAFE